jgi:hypothetical protein
MKKIISIVIIAMLAASIFLVSACDKKTANTSPKITVSNSEIGASADQEIDVLSGVTATDAEDGDLTSSITVTSVPALVFSGGKTTPTEVGTYEITYSISDSKGEKTENYATMTVNKQATETLYKEYSFANTDTSDTKGWNCKITEPASGSVNLVNGRMEINVDNSGTGDGQVCLMKDNLTWEEGTDYKIVVYVTATAAIKYHFIANDDTNGWNALNGSALNLDAGTALTKGQITFSGVNSTKGQIRLHFGKIDDQAEGAYSIYIEKIHIYTIKGNETETAIYSNDYSVATSIDNTGKSGDNSETASISLDNNALKFDISAYGTDSWNINLYQSTGINLTNGTKYRLTASINTTYAQPYELCFEDSTLDWQVRAGFDGGTYVAGLNTVSVTFTAAMDINGLYIKWALGKPTDGVTSNSITIDDIVLKEIGGDKDTVREVIRFTTFNKTTDFDTFNGTDEDQPNGIGTAYYANNSLKYRVVEFSSTDWHNKIIVNSSEFEAFARYRFEFTISSDVDGVTAAFFVNPVGSWDPRITGSITANKTEKTYSFEMTQDLVINMNMELLFQFGSTGNAALSVANGDITVSVTSLKIYKIA